MGLLSREDILKAEDRAFDEIEVPEWEGTIRLQALSARRRLWIERMVSEKDKGAWEAIVPQIVVWACVGGDSKPLFEDNEASVAAVSEKGLPALERIVAHVMKMNAIREADEADLGKGSMTSPDDALPSGSPSPSGGR